MVYRDIEEYIAKALPKKTKTKTFYNKHERYMYIAAGFDIETTRIETRGYMYAWTVSLDSDTVYGRLWSEFHRLIEALDTLARKKNANIIVWVANLGYEFSYIGRRFHWSKLFAVDAHEPLIARTGKIEFRECLSISGQGGLANLAETYCKTKKAVGDLDYDKIRVSAPEYCTPINETEDNYIISDTIILSEFGTYIFNEYAKKGENIPLTKTSIVQSSINQAVKDTGHEKEIKKAVSELFPPDKDFYNFIMQWLFRGGYTHASAWHVCVIMESIIGVDFTSSYPAVMLHFNRFPLSAFIETELETDGKEITDNRMQTMCVIFAANFSNIRRKTIHSIESKHKIIRSENAKFENGRLYYADRIQVFLTEVDYEIYKMFYDWDSIEIKFAYTAVRDFLPNYVTRPLKAAYIKKAQLKKAGKDDTVDYKNVKAFINSFYGCCVKRLNFETWKFDENTGLWYPEPPKKQYETVIKNQVLSPYWGIYVTALARLCLLQNVYNLDSEFYSDNVLYCDTDSIYMKNTPENIEIVEKWNKKTYIENESLPAEFYDIGCFDWIGGTGKDGKPIEYKFKTLGAKRYIKYCYEQSYCEVTAAGLPKKALEKQIASAFRSKEDCYIAYLNPKNKTGKIGYVSISEIFDRFDDGMYLSDLESDKKRAAYNPEPHEEYIDDGSGHKVLMSEQSSCAILPVKFSICNTALKDFLDLCERLQKQERVEF